MLAGFEGRARARALRALGARQHMLSGYHSPGILSSGFGSLDLCLFVTLYFNSKPCWDRSWRLFVSNRIIPYGQKLSFPSYLFCRAHHQSRSSRFGSVVYKQTSQRSVDVCCERWVPRVATSSSRLFYVPPMSASMRGVRTLATQWLATVH